MKRQILQMERSVDNYLNLKSEQEMIVAISPWKRLGITEVNIVFFRKKSTRYREFFKFPENINLEKIKIFQFSGFFKMNNHLYLGVLKKKDDLAVFMAINVNQSFMDQLSTISDFKIRFIDSQDFMGENVEKKKFSDITLEAKNFLLLPWPYNFKYMDFDTPDEKNLKEKDHFFILLIDYDKIFQKISGFDSHSIHFNIQKFVYFLIGLFATFIIISFFIGFRVIRVITKSINQITKGTKKIRKGDFSFKIKIKSGDQLQELAESFNEMASGIKRLLIEEKEKQRLEEELRIILLK